MYISHFTKQKVSVKIILPGQLTQLVECLLDVEEVGGSSPSLSTKKHAGCPLRVFLLSPAASLRRGIDNLRPQMIKVGQGSKAL